MSVLGLYDRVRWTVSGTPGTGNITLGSAVATFRDGTSSGGNANIPNGTKVSYVAEDGGSVAEYGKAIYSTTGPTLTRTPIWSTAGLGVAANLSSSAIVYIDCLVEDLNSITGALLFASQIQGGTGNINYYVDTGGSDTTGDGSIGNPWASVSHAVIISNLIIPDIGSGYLNVNINVNPGTYSEANTWFVLSQNSSITLSINSTTSVASDVIINFSTSLITVLNGFVGVSYLTLNAVGQLYNFYFSQSTTAGLALGNCNINFGTHIDASSGGDSIFNIQGGIASIGNCNFTSNSPNKFLYAYGGSSGVNFFGNIGLTGAFTGPVVDVEGGATANFSNTWTAGSVTGQRFLLQLNGIINTYGAGTSFIPGSIAGVQNLPSAYL